MVGYASFPMEYNAYENKAPPSAPPAGRLAWVPIRPSTVWIHRYVGKTNNIVDFASYNMYMPLTYIYSFGFEGQFIS